MAEQQRVESFMDEVVLRRAARVVRARSSRPNGFWLGVYCAVLTKLADKIREERHG